MPKPPPAPTPQTQLERLLIESLQQLSAQHTQQVTQLSEQLALCAAAQKAQGEELGQLAEQVQILSAQLSRD